MPCCQARKLTGLRRTVRRTSHLMWPTQLFHIWCPGRPPLGVRNGKIFRRLLKFYERAFALVNLGHRSACSAIYRRIYEASSFNRLTTSVKIRAIIRGFMDGAAPRPASSRGGQSLSPTVGRLSGHPGLRVIVRSIFPSIRAVAASGVSGTPARVGPTYRSKDRQERSTYARAMRI